MSVSDEVKVVSQAAVSLPRRAWGNAVEALSLIVRAPRQSYRPRWRSPGRLALAALIAALTIAALMVTVDIDTVSLAGHLPTWLRDAASEVTGFGRSQWFLVPLGGMLLLIAARASPALPKTMRLLLLSITVRLSFLFLAIALPSLFTTIVKRFIGRARPYVDMMGNPFDYRPFVWRSDFASMPSGHATTAVAAAVAIGLLWPRLRPLLWVYALMILASRVLLTAHYPSDVVAGAVVGAAGAYLMRDWLAVRQLGFAIEPDGTVRPHAGPSFKRIKRLARTLFAQ
jgi:undecaprenyl-diphosphatase